ncbi:efflux RND transporter periplasmic adaptor subunit [Algoriphagus aestuariicola]|uniref:Efflux RND transporter periplasmic adaptor subunit n=1 Tax=Algoriphagus aestuariicola TaxID=1852016 RepID=A0ABS3BWA8_9BACT|nr:efflux RND transporter periplasmic adaptor subunit [Algoriphagus aestuariicola]MBN7803378.1 efflux RND transporter periplasmic adaptor subunit [Algoriphagus aestuariicola]
MKLYSDSKKTVLGLLTLIVLLPACKEAVVTEAPPMKVNVVTAIQNDVPLYEEFVAQVYGQSDVDIRARVEGWVTSVNFKEGSEVKKGQLLYTIDDIEYKNRMDRQASEVAQATTELVRAESELSRVRPLTELNALSQKDLDNAVAQFEAAKAHVAATKSSLENAKIEMGYTRVYAPFDGIIGISNVREGDFVSRAGGSSVLATISSIDGVRVRFQISEREYLRIAQLSPEVRAQARNNVQLILADGTVYSEMGSVSFGDREIDPSTGTLTLEASFPNPNGLLRPGLFVKARILMSTYPGAVLVPQRAVAQLQHISQVYVVTDSSSLQVTSVETGPKVGDAWIIKSGLNPGDRVAIIGAAGLTANSKIEVVDQKWPNDQK